MNELIIALPAYQYKKDQVDPFLHAIVSAEINHSL